MTNEQELLSAGNDYIFKLIFGDERHADVTKDFLASVLNLSDEELAVLTFTNTELKREHRGDKLSVIDIRIKTAKGTDLNIEVQVVPYKAMATRSLFYWSKMFAAHLDKGDDYGKLPKTIAINILHFDLFDYERHHSTFRIREDNENIVLTELFRMDFLEILKIKDKPVVKGDKVTQWLTFLSTQDKEVLEMLSQENPSIGKAVGILKTLSGDEKVRMEAFYREREIRDEISRRISAEKEGITKVAANLLKMGLSLEQIKTATGLTEAEILAIKQ